MEDSQKGIKSGIILWGGPPEAYLKPYTLIESFDLETSCERTHKKDLINVLWALPPLRDIDSYFSFLIYSLVSFDVVELQGLISRLISLEIVMNSNIC